jgi:hypothetical protein
MAEVAVAEIPLESLVDKAQQLRADPNGLWFVKLVDDLSAHLTSANASKSELETLKYFIVSAISTRVNAYETWLRRHHEIAAEIVFLLQEARELGEGSFQRVCKLVANTLTESSAQGPQRESTEHDDSEHPQAQRGVYPGPEI